MNIKMSIKNMLRPILLPFVKKIYEFILVAAPGVAPLEPELQPPYYPNLKKDALLDYLKSNPDAEEKLYCGLDEDSVKMLRRTIALIQVLPAKPIPDDLESILYVNQEKLLTDYDKYHMANYDRALSGYQIKYPFLAGHPATDFYYKYGLIFLPERVKEYIKDNVFIDAGAYDGITCVMMTEFAPSKIYSFEPSPTLVKEFRKNLLLSNVSTEQYDLVQMGLGDNKRGIFIHDPASGGTSIYSYGETNVRVITLDEFVTCNNVSRVKWIKADIEGAAVEMIQGAYKVISRDHPILTLGVYHTPEELFEIKPLIESWNLGYKFMFRRTTTVLKYMPYEEITLIAWPETFS